MTSMPPPPASGRGVSRSPEVDAKVAELRSRPGEWEVVHTSPVPGSGPVWAYQSRGCQTTTRRHDGVIDLWACWPAPTTPKGTE